MPKASKLKINVKDRVDDNTIDLSLSQLSEVPVKDIALYKRATILDLSSNQLSTLGKAFSSLTHLTKLDLSNNQLIFLPEDFGKLTNLRHLNLFNNNLEHLPLSFGNLKALRHLDLKSNPLTPTLVKIVGNCVSAKDCQVSAKNTVNFLAEMHKRLLADREQQKLDEIKRKLEEEEEVERISLLDAEAKVDDIQDVKSIEEQKLSKKEKKKKAKKLSNEQQKQLINNTNDKVSKSKSSMSSLISRTFRLLILLIRFILIPIVIGLVFAINHPQLKASVKSRLPKYFSVLDANVITQDHINVVKLKVINLFGNLFKKDQR